MVAGEEREWRNGDRTEQLSHSAMICSSPPPLVYQLMFSPLAAMFFRRKGGVTTKIIVVTPYLDGSIPLMSLVL
jgi:hypothetical protein